MIVIDFASIGMTSSICPHCEIVIGLEPKDVAVEVNIHPSWCTCYTGDDYMFFYDCPRCERRYRLNAERIPFSMVRDIILKEQAERKEKTRY